MLLFLCLAAVVIGWDKPTKDFRKVIPHIHNTKITYNFTPIDITQSVPKLIIVNSINIISRDEIFGLMSYNKCT